MKEKTVFQFLIPESRLILCFGSEKVDLKGKKIELLD